MCGIIYAHRKDGKPARKSIVKRYAKQRERGKDGFGWLAMNAAGKIEEYTRLQTESEMRKRLATLDAPHVLFHHRFPTSTINVPESAHPIRIAHDELKSVWYVAHNGVLSNASTLKKKHEELGYRYTTEMLAKWRCANGELYLGNKSFNDSESLAIELARVLEGKQESVQARGSIAYIALETRASKAIALYYGTNGGNPLCVTESDRHLVIASSGGERINDKVCYKLNLLTGDKSKVDIDMPAYQYQSSLGYGAYSPYHYDGAEEDEEEKYDPKELEYDDDNELAWLQEQLGDVEADIAIARDAGEQTELEDLYIEKMSIEEQIRERARSLIGIH